MYTTIKKIRNINNSCYINLPHKIVKNLDLSKTYLIQYVVKDDVLIITLIENKGEINED